MIRIMLFLMVFLLAGCTGDDANKIFNKGGRLSNGKEYTFLIMHISSISASDAYSSAKICTNSGRQCFSLGYKGDLSDFNDYDLVNVTVLDGEIIDIDNVWFTTKWGYYPSLSLVGREFGIFFGRYLVLPIIILFALGCLLGRRRDDDSVVENK